MTKHNNEPMPWEEVCAGIAQGVVNVTEGLTEIQPGSRIHRAMAAFCEYEASRSHGLLPSHATSFPLPPLPDDTARKLHDKIRDAFQSNYRAALNMLSSLTADERGSALSRDIRRVSHDRYAQLTAHEACVATWGEEAVKAALGGGGA